MSESFFTELADQLRSQTPIATAEKAVETPVVEQQEVVEEPVAEPTVEPVQESVQEPIEEKQWWEEETQETITAQTKTEEKEQTIDLDDDLKLLMEYKKSGKTLNDFVKEYQIQDLSKLTDEQIVKQGLKDFMNLSDEEYEQAADEFDSASFFQKKQWAESFRQRYEEKNSNKLKELTSSNQQAAEQQKAVAEKYNSELNEFSQAMVNKEIYGLKVTDEMSKDLKTFIDKEFSLQRQDGSFDIEKMYSIALWLKYGKDLVKANVTKARNEGKEQVIKEVSNPSKNMTSGGRAVGSGLEAAQEAFNTLFQS